MGAPTRYERRLVRGSTLDYRVASWFERELVNDQAVALLTGLYTPYNPRVKDLLSQCENPGMCVHSITIETFLPDQKNLNKRDRPSEPRHPRTPSNQPRRGMPSTDKGQFPGLSQPL